MSKQSSRGRDWERTRARILDRDGHRCAYCGNEATTVDHVTPKDSGGTDDDWNLVASCTTCNSRKGARVLTRTNYVNPAWLDHL